MDSSGGGAPEPRSGRVTSAGSDAVRVAAAWEIERLPAVYALAVDVGDWETVRSVFHPDCVVEGSLGTATIDEYVPRIREFCEQFRETMHNVTTRVVEFEGEDRARLDSFSMAIYVDPLDGSSTRGAGAHYMDRVERRETGWKIAARRVRFPWRFDGS